MTITVPYTASDKQKEFHACGAEEVFYGGAKGGGKSCGLVMEALAYALEYAGAKCYLFRESYDDLEANLVEEWQNKVPAELYTYNQSKHIATLVNGTKVYFRYISNDIDAAKYQGRSIDFIGVDELTKHSQKAIQILLSCLRSPQGFPPVFRGTGNPGGKGHTWVKARYITPTGYGQREYTDKETGNRIAFIPATVYDNAVIMRNDPAYVRRLENLPSAEKKAFLHGDWDIFEGQYFSEWNRAVHVIKPFPIPIHWKRYFAMDYGLDMLAGYWIAVDTYGRAYVYKEIYKSGLIMSEAAKACKAVTIEKIYQYIAPPDLWNRRQDTGKSVADIFSEQGMPLTKAQNNRVMGWYNLKEWLQPVQDEAGAMIANIRIFENCENLIYCLPELQFDDKDPNDCATEPHEITHAPDALRYFVAGRPRPTVIPPVKDDETPDYDDQVEGLLDYGV
ncbi:MAG: terminase large subunit domain-containing protein [Acetanaerobacterium sp.]